MDRNAYRKIAETLGSRTMHMAEMDDPDVFIRNQRAAYSGVFSRAKRAIDQVRALSPSKAFDQYDPIIDFFASERFSSRLLARQKQSQYVTDWPILRQDSVRAIEAARGDLSSETFSYKTFVPFLAALIYECRQILLPTDFPTDVRDDPFLNGEIASYAGWKAVDGLFAGYDLEEIRSKIDEVTGGLKPQVEEFSKSIATARDNVAKQIEEADRKYTHFSSMIERLWPEFENGRNAIEKGMGDIRKSINEEEISLKDELEAFKASIRNELGLSEARKLWESRAFWSRIAFIASAMAFAIAICAVFIVIYAYGENIMDYLFRWHVTMQAGAGDSAVEQAFRSLPQIILLSFPIGLVVWLLRLVVRFNTRSLILMDDATQRHTILNTYLHMVEENVAKPTDTLAVTLEALFRRTPRHGPETIEPPNLTEFIQIGHPAKGGP